jgi:bifunctional oligoribonuclease and PAP phosphatase NrnA
MKQSFESCKEIFKSKTTFVLTTHINPDGDGLGSEVALALYLTGKGKSVAIINQSETPAYYKFMHALFPIATFSAAKHGSIIKDAEVIVALDTNSPARFSAMKENVMESRANKICIDHHLDREEFADLYLIDEKATATGEIVYNLLKFLDSGAITKPIADALYAAIMTDTGSFRFPKTDVETHHIIADLLLHGADPTEIYQKIFEEGPANKLKLLGRALTSLSVVHGGKVATMVLLRKDFSETQTAEEDTDNMINHAMSIGGVRVGLMFVELENGVKVSFRSKGDIAINALAKEFGGNGHKNAAGARIHGGTLPDVVNRVTERAAAHLLTS